MALLRKFKHRRPRAEHLSERSLEYVCLSVRLSVTPAVSGVRGGDEHQKISSVPRTLYVFNIITHEFPSNGIGW